MFDGEVASDIQLPTRVGLPLQNVPETAFAFIGSYRFTEGALTGLTSGLALNYNDAYLTNNSSLANSTRLTSEIALADVFFNYGSRIFGRKVTYNIMISNILNEDVYVAYGGTWGEARAMKASVKFDF